MILLAFGDLHGDFKAIDKLIKKARKADFLICSGDLSHFGKNYEKIIFKLDCIGKKIFFIHGNHDPGKIIETENVINVDKRIFGFGKFNIIGYNDGGFAKENKNIERFFLKGRGLKNLIIVTHGPAFGYKLDFLGEHIGNKSIRKIIEILKPKLHICGHLHEHFNEMDIIGKTLSVNAGPEGLLFEI